MESQANRQGTQFSFSHTQLQSQGYLAPLTNNQTTSAHSSVDAHNGHQPAQHFDQMRQPVASQQSQPQHQASSVSATSAELHLEALKDSFKQAANSLTQLYKQSSESYNFAYQQGRLDAYEDVLAWLVADQAMVGVDMKHVSVQRFRSFVQERICAQQMGQPIVPKSGASAAQETPQPQAATNDWYSEQQVQNVPLQKALVQPTHRIPPSVMSMKVQDSQKRSRPLSSHGIVGSSAQQNLNLQSQNQVTQVPFFNAGANSARVAPNFQQNARMEAEVDNNQNSGAAQSFVNHVGGPVGQLQPGSVAFGYSSLSNQAVMTDETQPQQRRIFKPKRMRDAQ